MRHTVPWSVKGVDQDAREAAKEAARRSGMSLGEWLNSAIADQAAEVADAAVTETGLSTVTRRLETISQRLDAVTRRESETAIPKVPAARGDNSDIVRALDAVARLAEISERRSAAAIEAVERLGGARAAPALISSPPTAPAFTTDRADHTAQMDAIARSMRDLDMPAPRHADATNGIKTPRKSFRSDIDSAVAEIAARQKALSHGREEAPARIIAPATAADPFAVPDMAPIAARLDALSRQIETVLSQQRPAPPRAPETTALAGEIGRLSQRIDAMAAPSSDGLQTEIKTLSGRVEQMRRDLAERETGQYDRAVADLRSDIAAIADQLSDLAPRRAVASLEAEVQGLGARLDAARAKGLPAEPLEHLVHEFEQAIARLMPAEGIAEELKALSYRVDSLASRDLSGGLLDRLAEETGAIRAMLADTVSRDAIDALGDQIAALGRRIDDLAQPRQTATDVAAITSAIEARIEEIAERLAAVPRPSAAVNPQLEEALHRLADKLEDGHARPDDPKALADIERHILSLASKIDAADGRFAQLGTIERGLSDLFVQMEEMRAGAIEAAEQAARRALASAPGSATDDEIESLRREIAEVRRSRTVIDQQGAGTVDAVQQTFERVARRIAEIEPAEAPAKAPSPSLAPREPEPALARPKATSASIVAERSAAPVSRQTAPNHPPGSIDLPLEPGSGAPRVRPPAPGAAPVGGTKTDFIAAARRAARAASVDPALRSEPEEAAKPGFFARFRGAPKPQDDGEPAAAEPKKPRWRAKAEREDTAPVLSAPEPVTIQPAAEAEPEVASKPVLAVNRKTILMGIAAALLVLAAGIATVPKIRSLLDATGTQQTAVPTPSIDATAAAPISGAPAATPGMPAPASNLSPASTSSTPSELTPPAAGPGATDPTPALPGSDTAPETTGSVTGGRTPPPGMTLSPSGWQPVDTRTGRAVSVPAALKAAADAGDPLAAHEMGTRHLEGRGVAVSAAEAARWYQRAADAGIVPAQYRLGSLYEKGTGVLRDFERARRLYERAGEAGNAKAMHNLAVMHAQGQATPRPDYKIAAQWFRRAAEHGVTDSQYNLGILYARGLGVDQSLAESYKWFALAAAGGDQDSAKKREEVAARLDPQTLVAARLAVQTFAPKAEPDAAVRVAAPAEWSDPPAPARPVPRRAQTTR
ncbi:MAG: hypothetical protein Q8O26_12360 [Phreatobacter sp.]|uniref:hypothetical protein n=1 Tax=Phreatobacter sp. TaxID=1966341 RepID=UPI0027363D95|nr:hypothetical protein [Phreatobacter sp.]MDP2802665.1 hypothetical protein [Phreatobacter sp.]